MQVKFNKLKRYIIKNKFVKTRLQKENSKLLEVIVAIKGQDFTIIANLQAKDTIIIKANIYAIKAEFKHKLKLSKDKPSKKKSKLN